MQDPPRDASSAPHSRASIVLLSDTEPPEKLSERLGSEPDETWHKGEPTTWGRPRSHHGWVLKSRLAETDPPEDHIAELGQRAVPIARTLAALRREGTLASIRFWISVQTGSWNSGITLTPSIVAELHRLGIGLDLDVYFDTAQPDVPSDVIGKLERMRPH